MKDAYFQFFDRLCGELQAPELLTSSFAGEASHFVRFNKGKIRQPGGVSQRDCSLTLVNGPRQASIEISLSGSGEEDLNRGRAALTTLREWLHHIPKDPHLILPEHINSTERTSANHLPEPEEMVRDIIQAAEGDDLVGILATGSIGRGFASSTGQKNWFTAHPYSLDWCLYHQGDKAVKTTYSGFEWDADELGNKMALARKKLAILGKPTRKVSPGEYRAYLTPAAVAELLGLCCWGGFSAQATQIGMSPLMRLASGEQSFDPRVSLTENLAEGVTEDFQESGFTRPSRIPLVEGGKLVNTLCSPRTAKEYDLTTNGANGSESPCALDMAGGDIHEDQILERLGTGLYVSNLWYLNFSDRSAGQMTGMTRFATLWIEDGKPVAPVDPMRFDESIFRIFGENLDGLTQARDFDLSTSSYHRRSTDSTRVPGAIVDNFRFTL